MSGGYEPVAPIDPVAPSPSLLTVARRLGGISESEQPGEVPEDVDLTFWRSGISWVSDACTPTTHEELCTDGARPDGTAAVLSTEIAYPFRYYTEMACDWILDGKLADRARGLTEARAAWALSRALWLGEGLPATITDTDAASYETLTLVNKADDVSAATALDVDDAFARLLSHYETASSGLGGAVLHVPTVLLPHAKATALIWKEGDQYRTTSDARVSPGPGYPFGVGAFGPGGASTAADEVWIYVTGPVEYALGDVRVVPEDEAQRRGLYRRNDYQVWAEREAIVRFDPCLAFAALVDSPAGTVS